MRRRPLFIGVAALLILGLLAIYLLDRVQPYQKTIEHGPEPEARANAYLAAELFLRQQGVEARRATGVEVLDDLPSRGQTLLLLGDRGQMTPRQAERVLQWTASGGRLVFVAEQLWDEQAGESGDLLLDLLEIRQHLNDDRTDGTPGHNQPLETEPHPKLAKFYVEHEQAPAYLGFDTSFHLYDPKGRATAWANSAAATHLLQLAHGAGSVTVLTDSWIWENARIADYDHAWLLWYLTQDSQVTLLHRPGGGSLSALLLRHYPQALLALALLLALTLWRVGMRQGPLQPAASPARRQLEEHLRASADFRLRHGGQHGLLQGLREEILQRARRRHPGFAQLAREQQWQQLARLCQLPPESIRTAMHPASDSLSAAEFTRQVADLQTLRNTL